MIREMQGEPSAAPARDRRLAKKRRAPQARRSAQQGFVLERFVPYLMTQIYHRLNKNFSQALHPLNLNPAQWRVLANLCSCDGQTFTELLQHTALDQPTLSRTVSRLVGKGLIVRRPKPFDGRSVELWLTTGGRRMFDRALPVGVQQYRLSARGIARSEHEQLRRALSRMLANLRDAPAARNGKHQTNPGSRKGTTRRNGA
jgi:DNA-binding MarR family transcriptional regulator